MSTQPLAGKVALTELLVGLKVVSASGWFAARPSGTENIYKLYAESLRSSEHLAAIVKQAQEILSRSLSGN